MNQEVFFIYAGLFFLFLLCCFLFFCFLKTKKRLDIFLKNGKQDIGQVLTEQIKISENQKKDIQDIFQKIEKLKKISEKSFQKIALKRFSPFKEVGGNQSFCMVLLDSENNGIVMTSYFSADFNRIYAKSIKRGKTNHSLSKEEKQTIMEAIEQK
ncbi:MAG: DUF4446 family protein [Patescibacteria group bacterium]|nr:DUF4446 family protein [Patescibacteria group bacterium]